MSIFYINRVCVCLYAYAEQEVDELGDSLQSTRRQLEESGGQNQRLKEELEQTSKFILDVLLIKLNKPFSLIALYHYIELQLETLTSELVDTKSFLQASQERVKELSVPPPEVPGADRQELLRMLDRRQHEISRLADEWKAMSSQLEITSAKKTEFQSR